MVTWVNGYELGENAAQTFRVENGLLRVVYEGYTQFGGKFGHLFYKTPFSNHILRVEYERPQWDPGDADAKKLIRDGATMLRGGYIALQAESHPVEFRKVEIQRLER